MKATLPTDASTWNMVCSMLVGLLADNIGGGLLSQESGPQECDNEFAIFSFSTGDYNYLVTLTAQENEYGPYISVLVQLDDGKASGPIKQVSTDWRLYL